MTNVVDDKVSNIKASSLIHKEKIYRRVFLQSNRQLHS